MRLVLPLLVLALAAPAIARGEVVAPAADDAALATTRAGVPVVAFVRGRHVYVATRQSSGWVAERVTTSVLPSPALVRGVAPDAYVGRDRRRALVAGHAVLVEAADGSWLKLLGLRRRSSSRMVAVEVVRRVSGGRLGAAGIALAGDGSPVVAYAVGRRDQTTELRLFRPRRDGSRVRFTSTAVTKRGFPPSTTPPAAAPLLGRDGRIRVVEAFTQRGASAILWRRERGRWWGRVLHVSTLGRSDGPIYAARAGDDVYVAWTIDYASFGELHVTLSARTDRSRSSVLHRTGVAVGLVLGPGGPEVAANTIRGGLIAGLVLSSGLEVELDGRIRGYVRAADGTWHVLLERDGRLEWFGVTATPSVRILLEGATSGRVEGARGGSLLIYRESAGAPREPVAEVPVDERGAFAIPPLAPATWYRFVYERDLPYALLVGAA